MLKIEIPSYIEMDECDFTNRSVIVRADFNSPIDPTTRRILDITRIKSHVTTVNSLVASGAKVVLIAHQGQKGADDFVSLQTHAGILSSLINKEVRFVDEVYGRKVEDAVGHASYGDVLLLENLRFTNDETRKVSSYAEHAQSELVRSLSSITDFYINDAFATAHRAHASIVGFPILMPSAAGKLMASELNAIKRILDSTRGPTAFILGGGKLSDSISLLENSLVKNVVDKVIVTGLVANAFLLASGRLRSPVLLKNFEQKGFSAVLEKASEIVKRYPEKIVMPVDLAAERGGERVEFGVEQMDDLVPLDIGERSLGLISDELQGFRTAFLRGPAGVVEKKGFEKGTVGILHALVDLGVYTVIGGGHTRIMAEELNLVDRLGYASTGGGALLALLSGEPLPAIQALHLATAHTRCGNRKG